ncbi:hypothetical protein WBG78_20305 [Chryseolinea sp. T2]|uniref:hypothetical protein n=1 Tax=Chryseolinea sp. T2 TaxID=3129255 RepID=UPI003076E0AD
MTPKTKRPSNLIFGGKGIWERTAEFNRKADEIKKEVMIQYKPMLSSETNLFKRTMIHIRIWMEIRKRINELSSTRNLHFAGH